MQPKQWFGCQMGGLLGAVGLTIAGVVAMPQSVLAKPGLVSQQLSWSDLWRSLRRPRRDQGGKGQLCLLVPAQADKPEGMWHDRPLFVWRGLELTIGLRQAGSETVFWRRSLSQPGTLVNQIQYTGPPLQPGQSYELLLFSSPTAAQPGRPQPFTVMSASKRAPVTTALQALTAKLAKEKASEETIAQERARYFLDHDLQTDALQEVYRVKKASAALSQVATDISERLCSSP
ncbi:MAG: hypothetical protein WCA35_16740 [Kovacikia sp.]